MNVLYSNPPWWEGREWVGFRRWWRTGVRAGSRWPFTYLRKHGPGRHIRYEYLPYPFFMGYAATYVAKQTGANVTFRDSIALKESIESYFQFLKGNQFDYLFIESATPSWEQDAKVIRKIHEIQPRCKIVVTGPITVTKASEILQKYPVHACIRGEYEKGSVKVVNGASGIIDFDLLTLAEMNAAPFPYFDKLHAHRYWDANPVGQKFPHAQIWSSRGCPFKCIFCVWPAAMTGNDPDGKGERKVRQYSADYMEAFIREIVDRYEFKSIYFDDDTFNIGNKHVVDMCGVMSRIGLPWSAMCRADTIRMETWKIMKESGCFGVKIGFESGNQMVVDKIVNKHLDLEYAKEAVHTIKKLGMTVHGTFTYGLPGETREQMLDTRRFIESLPFDSYQESGTAEIEGTPLHTLRQTGQLDKYAGARIDSAYERASDGNKKWQAIVQQIKTG